MLTVLSHEYVFIPLAVVAVLGVGWLWGKLRGSYNPFHRVGSSSEEA